MGKKLQSDCKGHQEKIGELEAALQRSCNSLEEEAKLATQQINSIKREKNTLQNSLNVLKSNLDKSEIFAEDLKKNFNRIKKENEFLKKISSENENQIGNEIEVYKLKLGEKNKYQDALQTENVVMRNEISKLNGDNTSLKI